MLSDAKQREQALDCLNSYIVQAPAGSGKTGVLTQRILGLLALVSRPEEVVAITFTKKAAGEMRQRVLESITEANSQDCPDNGYEAQTWHLCQAVLARDKAMGWHLLQHPNRLKIQTIDGFCGSLVKQMPFESGMGSMPAIEDDATTQYETAAKQLVNSLGAGAFYDDALRGLLQHLDNDYRMAVNLIAQMLSKRDHWLECIMAARNGDGGALRQQLEDVLQEVCSREIISLNSDLSTEQKQQLASLALFAAQNLQRDGIDSPITLAMVFENNDVEECNDGTQSANAWLAFSELLLTKSGPNYRKSVTAKLGFPAPSSSKDGTEKALFKERKDSFLKLVGELSEDSPDFSERLFGVRKLPLGGYSDEQWQLLVHLLELMPVAVGFLTVLWQESGSVDFTEISMAALRSLGSEEEPTDLTLKYDNRISHILVDEFQDTSTLQIQLLEKLTAGWQRGDGRTLFLVGDPMQGIYSFRKADIGLFLGVWHAKTLGQISLETLKLETNFRSDNKVIQWINSVFLEAFPSKDNGRSGAVSYSSSVAAKSGGEQAGVTLTLFQKSFVNKELEGDATQEWVYPDRESKAIAETIQRLKNKEADLVGQSKKSYAVLVRSKASARAVINELAELDIPYRAVDIDTLQESGVIQQLLGITRALLRPSDRIGWYSVLRGPWAGLSLKTLEALHSYSEYSPLWNNLVAGTMTEENEKGVIPVDITPSQRERLSRVVSLFAYYYDRRKQFCLRDAVETLWCNLGGELLQENSLQMQEDSKKFFSLLEGFEASADLANIQLLEKKAMSLFASPGSSDPGAVQIMSMHKSKGLEFDYVFLPYGAKRGRSDDRPLLIVDNQLSPGTGEQSLFLAALPARGKDVTGDAVYEYLWGNHAAKLSNELSRLTYVACTRAKQHLYLSGTFETDKKGEMKPPSSATLLGSLWKGLLRNDLVNNVTMVDAELGLLGIRKPILIFRDEVVASLFQSQEELFGAKVSEGYRAQGAVLDLTLAVDKLQPEVGDNENSNVAEAERSQADIGTFAHRLYKQFADRGGVELTPDNFEQVMPLWQLSLTKLHIPSNYMPQALKVIERAVLHLNDNPAQAEWLFMPRKSAHSEYAVGKANKTGEYDNFIIDRTFVDHAGTRWIIDYKFSEPKQCESMGLNEFIVGQAALYKEQLENYADIMNLIDPRDTCMMLYFPLVNRHHCWSYDIECVSPFE